METEPLFELIRAMSPEEKRIFKLQSKKYERKGGNSYLHLFSIYENMETYDARKLKTKIAAGKFGDQLHVTRAYLFDLLLDVIARKSETEDFQLDLQRQLARAHVLYTKGLFEQALKRVRKIKRICEAEERPLLALQAGQLTEKIAVKLNSKELLAELVTHDMAYYRFALKQYDTYLHYRSLSFRLSHFVNNQAAGSFAKQDKQETIALFEALEPEPPEFATAETRIVRLSALSLYYRFTGSNELALNYALEALETGLQTNLEKLTTGIGSILNLFNNAAVLLTDRGKTGEVDQLIERVLQYKARFKSDRVVMEERITMVQLTLKNAEGKHAEIDAMLPAVEQFIDSNARTLTSVATAIICYNIMVHYFYTGRFHPALRWLNRLLTTDQRRLSRNILENILAIELLLHFELKNNDLLASRLKTNLKLMHKYDTCTPLEETLTWHFNRYLGDAGENRNTILSMLQQELEKLRTDTAIAYRFNDFAYHLWVQSNREGKTIAELLAAERG